MKPHFTVCKAERQRMLRIPRCRIRSLPPRWGPTRRSYNCTHVCTVRLCSFAVYNITGRAHQDALLTSFFLRIMVGASQTAAKEQERKSELVEKQHSDVHHVPVVAKYREEKKDSQDRRESLSAYFTIAAAAFGLISDGCVYQLSVLSVLIFAYL